MSDRPVNENLSRLALGLESLVIFRNLLSDPVIRHLHRLLPLQVMAPGEDAPQKISRKEQRRLARIARRWGKVCAALYPETPDLSRYVTDRVLEDDNFYVRAAASRQEIPAAWQSQLERELEILRELSQLRATDLQAALIPPQAQDDVGAILPPWETSPLPLAAEYARRLANLLQLGYGIYARHRAFSLRDGHITPVVHPDPQRLDQLFGYDEARQKILDNTRAFLGGSGGSHMLLYGDAGTGKSSTIKAVAREYADQGLRLIEIKKDQLQSLADVLAAVADNPLKFILFIDDLSFSGTDDRFAALKAALEGSISVPADNTLIYATSNRRHLVRESAAARQGDDIHLNDTLQETSSLAARFGLTITFQQPDKEEYLLIVDRLADELGLPVTDGAPDAENPHAPSRDQLHQRAEQFALRANGRSPRAARQFIAQEKTAYLFL